MRLLRSLDPVMSLELVAWLSRHINALVLPQLVVLSS